MSFAEEMGEVRSLMNKLPVLEGFSEREEVMGGVGELLESAEDHKDLLRDFGTNFMGWVKGESEGLDIEPLIGSADEKLKELGGQAIELFEQFQGRVAAFSEGDPADFVWVEDVLEGNLELGPLNAENLNKIDALLERLQSRVETNVSAFNTVAENFLDPEWEKLPRLKELSGLSPEEIEDLPSNSPTSKFLTAVMRGWQQDLRSREVEMSANPQTVEGFQGVYEEIMSEPESEQARKLSAAVEKKVTHVVHKPGEGEGYPSFRMLDEMVNPFDPEGPNVYGTEYAQLVNLAARKAQQEGILNRGDVLRLTVLATLQYPPGYVEKGGERPTDEFMSGIRTLDEKERLSEDGFLFRVPLTQERIRDPEFVERVTMRRLVSSKQFRKAVKSVGTFPLKI